MHHTVAATRCLGSGEALPSEQAPAQGDTVVRFTYDIKGHKQIQNSTQINSPHILHSVANETHFSVSAQNFNRDKEDMCSSPAIWLLSLSISQYMIAKTLQNE